MQHPATWSYRTTGYVRGRGYQHPHSISGPAILMSVVAISARVTYRDPKRHGWLLSIAVPLVMWTGPLLYGATGNAAWFWAPVAFFYLGLPILDHVIGVDTHNPPDNAVPSLEADRYYPRVAYAVLTLLWITLIGAIWQATQGLPWWAIIPVMMGAGSAGGFAINVAHELGHKHDSRDAFFARLALAPTAYGHFTIDHNRGHHAEVATPKDVASARMGENIYAFAWRELRGVWLRAWRLEKQRLTRSKRSTWSPHNQILQTLAITAAFWTGILLWLGWRALPFIVIASFWANFQLTSANYIEHYWLLRKKLSNGRYEPCQPHHSWNSDHKLSNYALLHLQRHSDHHAWPTRSYQTLRHFSGLPQLPNGYFGMFVLAYIPPLWFRVMDPRLIAAVNRDVSGINFHPRRRTQLVHRYDLAKSES